VYFSLLYLYADHHKQINNANSNNHKKECRGGDEKKKKLNPFKLKRMSLIKLFFSVVVKSI
jgi:hypothetical protein